MDVECPYCSTIVGIASLERHVRLAEGGGHGSHGSVPIEGVDNPWQLRLDVADPSGDTPGDVAEKSPDVDVVASARRGQCPSCELGGLGLKGGDGRFSSGRRRLVCPNCGWESPEWINIRE